MNNEQITKAVNAPKAIMAVTVMGTAAVIMFLMLPLFVGAVAENIDITEQQLGFLASSDVLGYGVGAIIALFWARQFNWQKAVIILLVLLIGMNLLSIVVLKQVSLLIASRIACGLVQGSLATIYTAHISDTLKPEKYYAYFLAVQTVAGGIGLLLMPQFVEKWGVAPVIYVQCILAAIALIMAFYGCPNGALIEQQPMDKK